MLPNVFCGWPPQQMSLAYWWPCFLWTGMLLYIAYEKWACCQIHSCLCIYPDESWVKGKTLSMFKGHAVMVTLPQMFSNRLCHSLNPVRVKGDTTWTHDAGDTFITGCALAQWLKRRTHFSAWHVSQQPTSFFSNQSLLSCNSFGRVLVPRMWFAFDSLSEA